MTNFKKALIEYEGKQYWVDLTGKEWEVKTLKNGKFAPTLKEEVNFADLLWKGHVISNKKPA